jgi:D-alanine-D-alanine ligase
VVVLYGAVAPEAPPDEQDVLDEVQAVSAALERLGHEPVPLALDLDLEGARRQLEKLHPALVFNLVESIAGSGRFIHLATALLEELTLSYTGSPTEALVLSSNKLLTKKLLQLNEIATPCLCDQGDSLSGSWIIKSIWEHASIGIDEGSVVHDRGSVPKEIEARRARYGGEWFAESFIDGREFTLGLLARAEGVEVLPVAEMLFEDYPAGKPRIVDYAAKWYPSSFEYWHTVHRFATAGAKLHEQLNSFARRCWSIFGLRGYARVDFRVDERNRPWVLEINANPCLAPDAGFAVALVEAGIAYDHAIEQIIEDATRR